MVDRTMSAALARTQTVVRDATVGKHENLESKKRAIESPEVNAFIKDGTAAATTDVPNTPRFSLGTQPVHDSQLNAKIPAELYQRARRAVFENQMSNLEPRTLQDLVSQALSAELRRLGY